MFAMLKLCVELPALHQRKRDFLGQKGKEKKTHPRETLGRSLARQEYVSWRQGRTQVVVLVHM